MSDRSERDELHFGPSRSVVPTCDFCWAREHVDDNPDVYMKEHPDRPVMVLGYRDSTNAFMEAITICEQHFKDLKSFVRGLSWEAFK